MNNYFEFSYTETVNTSLKLFKEFYFYTSGIVYIAFILILALPVFCYLNFHSLIENINSANFNGLLKSSISFAFILIIYIFTLIYIPYTNFKKMKRILSSKSNHSDNETTHIVFSEDQIQFTHKDIVINYDYSKIIGFFTTKHICCIFLEDDTPSSSSLCLSFPIPSTDKSSFTSFLIWEKKIHFFSRIAAHQYISPQTKNIIKNQ